MRQKIGMQRKTLYYRKMQREINLIARSSLLRFYLNGKRGKSTGNDKTKLWK